MKPGDIVWIVCKRKRSQNWTRRGRVVELDPYGFKVLVRWDYPRRQSWIDVGQLHKRNPR